MPSKTKKYHRKNKFRKTAKGGAKKESIPTDLKKKKLISIMESSAKTKKEKDMLDGFRRTFIRKYIEGYALKKIIRKTPGIGYGINIDTPLNKLPYKLVEKIHSHYMEYLDDKRKFDKKVDKMMDSMTKTIKKESSKLNTLRSNMKSIEKNIVDPDTLYDKYENDLKHSKNADTIVKAALGMSIYDPKRRNKTVKTRSA
jgi:hypothetical protein